MCGLWRVQNVVLKAFEKDKPITVHHSRVKRYLYPLRGLGAIGDARNGYLSMVLDQKKVDGNTQYKVSWQLQRGTKIEWIDESIVPLQLILDYLDRLEQGIGKVDPTRLVADNEGESGTVDSGVDDQPAVERTDGLTATEVQPPRGEAGSGQVGDMTVRRRSPRLAPK